MEQLSIEQLKEKYDNIEDKIPSNFATYEEAGVQLAQDLCYHWDVKDAELIRVIALVSLRAPRLKITQHVYMPYEYMGLYPETISAYKIISDKIK